MSTIIAKKEDVTKTEKKIETTSFPHYDTPCAARKEAKEHSYGTQSRYKLCIALYAHQEMHCAANDYSTALRTTQQQQAQLEAHSAT